MSDSHNTSSSNEQQAESSTRGATKLNENVSAVPRDKHSVSKRLQQELLSLMMSNEKSISAFPDGDNLFKWIGIIQGPVGTVSIHSLTFYYNSN